MSKQRIIFLHLAMFIVLVGILLLTSEIILNYFAEGIHDVGMWLNLMVYGSFFILSMTIISCLIFLKQKKALGVIILLVNLFWIWGNVKVIHLYYFTDIDPTYYIPDWVLILNTVFAIIGVVIGGKVITEKLSVKKALAFGFLLIILGFVIQQV